MVMMPVNGLPTGTGVARPCDALPGPLLQHLGLFNDELALLVLHQQQWRRQGRATLESANQTNTANPTAGLHCCSCS